MKRDEINKLVNEILDNEIGRRYDDLDSIVYEYFADDIGEVILAVEKKVSSNKEKYLTKEDGVLRFRDPYQDKKSLYQLFVDRECLQEEIDNAWDEYHDYDRRVEEFRYCGYNEEDRDFHAMCLELNALEDNVRKLEDEQDTIQRKINRFDDELIEQVCEEECFEW